MNITIFDYVTITPLKFFGLTHRFWIINLDTIVYTWAAMIFMLIIALIGRRSTKQEHTLLSVSYRRSIELFIGLCKESLGTEHYPYIVFLGSLFLFTFFTSAIGLIPFLDEATKDPNTTFALAIISFFYITKEKIKTGGLKGYFKEFIEPTPFLMPMHIVGELSKIASMSFRLFGNILGGGVILAIIIDLIASYKTAALIFVGIILCILLILYASGLTKRYQQASQWYNNLTIMLFLLSWVQIFFGIIEGLIQSFVLMMLTTTYLSMGINAEQTDPDTQERQS